jgi:hypothetical protein
LYFPFAFCSFALRFRAHDRSRDIIAANNQNITSTIMKYVHISVFLLIAALVMSCSKAKQNTNADQQSAAQKADTVQRMSPSSTNNDFSWKDAKYTCKIQRTPTDSLPKVKDENGTVFADNSISVTISKNGSEFFKKTFTKESFSYYITDDFKKNGILEGIVFDNTAADGIHLAASVCYPQSDMLIPLVIVIDSKGGISISKDTRTDDNSTDEGD